MARHKPWMTLNHLKRHLNFFRIHVLFFTFTPLIFSAIFYAANGENHVSYIDALFNCVSAVTVCGLATVDISSLTGFQQALLFFQSAIGSPVVVSWVMVFIRRRYFAKRFQYIIETELNRRRRILESGDTSTENGAWGRRLSRVFTRTFTNTELPRPQPVQLEQQLSPVVEEKEIANKGKQRKEKKFDFFHRKSLRLSKLRPDMIRRMDDVLKPIDPNGIISEPTELPATPAPTPIPDNEKQGHVHDNSESNSRSSNGDSPNTESSTITVVPSTDNNVNVPAPIIARTSTIQTQLIPTQTQGPSRVGGSGIPLGHTLTVEFRTPDRSDRNERNEGLLRGRRPSRSRDRRPSIVGNTNNAASSSGTNYPGYASSYYGGQTSRSPDRLEVPVVHDDRDGPTGVPMTRRTATILTHRSHLSQRSQGSLHSAGKASKQGKARDSEKERDRRGTNTMHRGYGGFPYPPVLIARLLKKLFPNLEKRFVRTLTIPRTQTIQTQVGVAGDVLDTDNARFVKYISFNAVVGRNSKFHLLTASNLEELGGVEYRALTALLYLVAFYYLFTQLLAFTVIAPYISQPRWEETFVPPAVHKKVVPAWFAAFQVVSAFTNTGMSLSDSSMTPYQKAYPMIVFMIGLILAGNTAFPIFLRFMIWTFTKLVPKNSRVNETLHFLLDHPRRCFVYLFPSHQTWFLLTVLLILNGTDWFFFLVLDIGNSAFEAIPIGVRFIIGLLQATAVRAAGFATISLSQLAPAVQALYVMMMYISVYPIALSVRSTNVYEEKSLGVFDEEEESEPNTEGDRITVWGRYLSWHARRQLAFDMWWLGLAFFVVCIIERSKIQDEQNLQWFTLFSIIFELISAYGDVGLSLGVPYANFSFSGALTPGSKLIVCAVMLRGRHRGLPVAIDRAVMLPIEFKKAPGAPDNPNAEEDDSEEDNTYNDNVDEEDPSEEIEESRSSEKVNSGEGSPLKGRTSFDV